MNTNRSEERANWCEDIGFVFAGAMLGWLLYWAMRAFGATTAGFEPHLITIIASATLGSGWIKLIAWLNDKRPSICALTAAWILCTAGIFVFLIVTVNR